MTSLRTLVAVLAVTGLSACAGGLGNPFERTSVVDLNAAGNVGDPTSPAYFQTAVGDRVLFAVDENGLSPEAMATLDGQAEWLLANTDFSALIEGHADEQGTRAYNLALGARRAASVRDYLVSKGVSEARLSTVTYGKERPVALCSDESCWSQNRRAVTVVSAPVGS